MRTPIVTLVTLLSLAACAPGTYVVTVREPAPAPRQLPPPRPIDPLEITIARPVAGRLYLQTNRPAYVAIFDIIPERGVALIYPTSARQRRFVLSGLSWVPVWWTAHSTARYGTAAGRQPARYIYAVASDEPLRLPEEAFQPGYFNRVLGQRASRATDPYATMRALSRHFVTAAAEERWAEDAYVLIPSRASEPYRVARVYCANGTVYEVPADFADRMWCPTQTVVAIDPDRLPSHDEMIARRSPTRPDSVLHDNGRRVRRRPNDPPGRGPIDRVTPQPATVGDETDNAKQETGESKDHPGKGRALGHTDDADQRGRGAETRKRDEAREHPESRPTPPAREDPRAEPRRDPRPEPKPESEVKAEKQHEAEKRDNADKSEKEKSEKEKSEKPEHPRHQESKPVKPESGSERSEQGEKAEKSEKTDVKAEKHESRSEHGADPRSERRHEPNAEPAPDKGEAKADSKADSKPDSKPETKPESSAESKGDAKQEPKAEPPGQGEKRSEQGKSRGRPGSEEHSKRKPN